MDTDPVDTESIEAQPIVRIVAIDDHEIVLRGLLAALVDDADWVRIVATCSSVPEYLAAAHAEVDVVLLDLNLGDDQDPADSVRRIVATGTRVLIFTSDIRPVPCRRAIKAGAMGIALKSDPVAALLGAISTVAAGEFAVSGAFAHVLAADPTAAAHLAPRELEALRLLAQGLPQKSIGRRMDPPLKPATIREYLNRVAAKYAAIGRPVQGAHATLHEAIRDGHLDMS